MLTKDDLLERLGNLEKRIVELEELVEKIMKAKILVKK